MVAKANRPRVKIYNQQQHPYRHTGDDFAYTHPSVPGVGNINQALNYIFAIVRPNAKASVATPGDLPTVGNALGDYRVVLDDGDGKQAGYMWEHREGTASPTWYKTMDVDWSTDSILAKFIDVTLPLYVYKSGTQDLDVNGDVITGTYAGQTIYGGEVAGQNLTLNANSGDGVGAQTGYVQVDSDFRPVVNNTFDLSTSTERWKNAYLAGFLETGTLRLSAGSITDSSGAISFGDENLSTTGNITGAIVTGTSLVADNGADTMTLAPGVVTDTTGAVSFGALDLSTTGSLGAGVSTFTQGGQTLTITPLLSGPDRSTIISSTGVIDFAANNLITTGTLQAGDVTVSRLDVDNLRLDGNTISTLDTDGNLVLSPNGTGSVQLTKSLIALGGTFTGTLGVTGQLNVDNLRIDGSDISSTAVDSNIQLIPNGTGRVVTSADFRPLTDDALTLGRPGSRFSHLYISNQFHDGTRAFGVPDFMALRNNIYRDAARTQAAQDGDALFYNAASGTWLASVPNSEITHGNLSGLTAGDAGHTQFAMLAGRSGGQELRGGEAASENLVLESTSDATKGSVLFKDTLAPFTDASYSGGWNGTDLGGTSNKLRDVYSRGEFKGLRFENILSSSLPTFSGQTPGRMYYATDNGKAYVDTGTAIKVLGVSKFQQDLAFNGTDLTKDVDVSSAISDARAAQWQLMDNVNSFEIMSVKLTMISATTVRISTNIPLPAGNYRLIGIE